MIVMQAINLNNVGAMGTMVRRDMLQAAYLLTPAAFVLQGVNSPDLFLPLGETPC